MLIQPTRRAQIRPTGLCLGHSIDASTEGAGVDLLILGASARAAAGSAIRIGLRPTGIDLFGDADLAPGCPSFRVDREQYPEGLFAIAERLPATPWLYTGALENRPDLVDRLSTTHRLLGNTGAALRQVRDPIALGKGLLEAGLVTPSVRIDPEGVPIDGSWLRKPLASAGGRGIHRWIGEPGDVRRPGYYQERVEGLPLAAIFVGEGGTARCLGITRQFVGKGSNRFAYRGSLGPWPVAPEVLARVDQLGQAIGSWFGLVGLFGVDLILKQEQPWPVEVNPRYTASVEVLEWALGRSLLSEHLKAAGWWTDDRTHWIGSQSVVAKAIVFADRAFQWPSDWTNPPIDPREFPEIADVPQPGSTFRPGDPVLTVFARDDSPERCRRALGARVFAWRHRLRRLAASMTLGSS